MNKIAVLLASLILCAGVNDAFAKKGRSLPLKEVKHGVAMNYTTTAAQKQFPKYPGGVDALLFHFGEGSFVPTEVRNSFGGNLKLTLSFDIANDGMAQNVKVVALNRTELDHADKEVIRQVEQSIADLQHWTPAMVYGTPVEAQFAMTIVVNNSKKQDPQFSGGTGFANSFRPLSLPQITY